MHMVKTGSPRGTNAVAAQAAARSYPTPTAVDWTPTNGEIFATSSGTMRLRRKDGRTSRVGLAQTVAPGGKLNPVWVAWLMGWILGFTDLKPLGMGRYQQWLRLHGLSCCDD